MIYLDNAATTMHKPQEVIDAVTQAMCSLGNAGRGATSGALDAARTIHACRAKLARLLGCPRADHVCFTSNSTAALNTVINGVVHPGDPFSTLLQARPVQRATGPERFLNDGRLDTLPRTQRDRLEVFGWLAERAMHDTELLDEKELTRRLAALADDPVALRRYLVDAGVLKRDADGRNYRRGSSGTDPA